MILYTYTLVSSFPDTHPIKDNKQTLGQPTQAFRSVGEWPGRLCTAFNQRFAFQKYGMGNAVFYSLQALLTTQMNRRSKALDNLLLQYSMLTVNIHCVYTYTTYIMQLEISAR